MDLKAFSQLCFDPRHEFRGSKMLRRARRRVVILSHRDELLPMDVESNLEQRAAPHYLRLSHRGCGGHTVENGVPCPQQRVSLPKTRPRPLHAI